VLKMIDRWVLLALLSAAFGGASIFTGQVAAKVPTTEAQQERMRAYASAVQRGERSPSPEVFQALTNSSLASDAAMAAASDVMTWVGIGTLGIGLILAMHLGRSRITKA
jgi:hypothetical protein